jgi:hypothetical protein
MAHDSNHHNHNKRKAREYDQVETSVEMKDHIGDDIFKRLKKR